MAVLNFDKNDSISVKELSASLESTKLEVRYSGPLLKKNYTSISNCIADTLISNISKFLWEYNLVLEGKNQT